MKYEIICYLFYSSPADTFFLETFVTDPAFGGFVSSGKIFEIERLALVASCSKVLTAASLKNVETKNACGLQISKWTPKRLSMFPAASVSLTDVKRLQILPLRKVRGGHSGEIEEAVYVDHLDSDEKIWKAVCDAYRKLGIALNEATKADGMP